MEETLYTDLIAKYLSGNIDATERDTLWAWVESDAKNRQFFDQMVQLWGMSSDYVEERYETNTTLAWSKLEGRLFGGASEAPILELKSSNKIRILSIKRAWMAAAAVILLALTVGIWLYQNPIAKDKQLIVFQTGAQERRMIQLPDSTKIWLNENTRLSFEKNFTPRVVELEGEAFFDVTKQNGNPFTIQSGGAETMVIGTTFNVRAYPQEEKVEVTVKTGTVALRDKKDVTKKIELIPGESGVFDKQTQEVVEVAQPTSNADAWKTQRLDFDDTPMAEVKETLERYFGVVIQIEKPEILKCTFKNSSASPNLDEIILLMEEAMALEVERQGNVLIISGKGCN